MMEGSCLDCPFRRDSSPSLGKDGVDPFDFVHDALSESEEGEFSNCHTCPESGEKCYGQLSMMRNCSVGMMFNPLSELYDVFMALAPDHENYFSLPMEFIAFHDYGEKFYGIDWFLENHGKGNKSRKDPVPILPK